MERPEMQNAIRVNMRGFLPNSPKRFVLCENRTGSDEFTVTLIHGEFVEHTVVYTGKMTAGEQTIRFWSREPNLEIDKIIIEEVK